MDKPVAVGWERVVEHLVEGWRGREEVEAVLLFGSCGSGVASGESDIDLLVVLKPGARGEEPGLRAVDGWVVEVFAHDRAFFEGFFEKFHADNSRVGQSQFATGRVLSDRTGEGEALRAVAREWLGKSGVGMTEGQAYWPKRIIWSHARRLVRAMREGGADFRFGYHHFLYLVYGKYAAFLGQPVIEAHRLHRYLADAGMRRRYLLGDFPDGVFAERLARAIVEGEPGEMMRHAEALRDRALAATGGFEVPESSTVGVG